MIWGVTPEVFGIVDRLWRKELAGRNPWDLSIDEVYEANERIGARLNIDPERIQIMLSYGPDRACELLG